MTLQNNRFIQAAALLVFLSVLHGCALSPQVVRIRPVLDLSQLAPRPQAASLALTVSDARQSALVGYRGGVYATAAITTDADLMSAVHAELARAFSQRGFRVAGGGDAAEITLAVEIAELGYAVSEDRVTRTIETVATVRARSTTAEKTRTGEYQDRRTREVVKAPSAQDNEELINAVLAAALQRLVSDPDLL